MEIKSKTSNSESNCSSREETTILSHLQHLHPGGQQAEHLKPIKFMKSEDHSKRNSEKFKRPIVGKDIKLPTVFRHGEEHLPRFTAPISDTSDLPYWKKMSYEKNGKANLKYLKKDFSTNLITSLNHGSDIGHRLEARLGKTPTINKNREGRGSKSCPKYFSQDNKLSGTNGVVSKNQSFQYIDFGDLEKKRNPEACLAKLITLMQDKDWNIQIEGVTDIRSLIKFDGEIFDNSDHRLLSDIFTALSTLIISLRSFVAKSSIVAITEAASALGTRLDKHLSVITKHLLLKSSEKNAFLTTEIDCCLKELALNCTPSKVISCMLRMLPSMKGNEAKEKLGGVLEKAISSYGSSIFESKIYNDLLAAFGTLLIEPSPDVRKSAKLAVQALLDLTNQPNLVRVALKSYLPDSYKSRDLTPTKSSRLGKSGIYKGGKKRRIMMLPHESHLKEFIRTEELVKDSGKHRHGILPRMKVTERTSEESIKNLVATEEDNKKKLFTLKKKILDDLFLEAESPDWNKRIQIHTSLIDLARQHADKIKQSKYYYKYFDVLISHSKDSNVKVQISCITQLYMEVIPAFKELRERVCNNLVAALFNLQTSNSQAIKQHSGELFIEMIASQDPETMNLIVARQFINLPIKAKSNLIHFMISNMDRVKAQNVEAIIPIINMSTKEAKGELNRMSENLLNSFISSFGESSLRSAPSNR